MDKLIIDIAQQFIDGPIDDLEIIKGGLINSTYVVRSNGESFLLQKVNKAVFQDAEAIQFNLQLVGKFLSEHHYPKVVLNPLSTPLGQSLVVDETGSSWRLLPYIANTDCHELLPDDTFAKEAALALGEFHATLTEMNPAELKIHLPEFTNFSARLTQFDQALGNSSLDRQALAKDEIAFAQAHRELIQRFINIQPKLPIRIIHGDPKLSNFLFHHGKSSVAALIDLDTLMPGTVLYDFGDMVRSFCNIHSEDDQGNGVFNAGVYQNLKSAYLVNMRQHLTNLEFESMELACAAVILVQALRFLTDFLNGDCYYRIDFPMHNRQRAQNQICLLQGFLEEFAI
jgi:Ser/Thr protein kinase RdoA (MazF antagonist)